MRRREWKWKWKWEGAILRGGQVGWFDKFAFYSVLFSLRSIYEGLEVGIGMCACETDDQKPENKGQYVKEQK